VAASFGGWGAYLYYYYGHGKHHDDGSGLSRHHSESD
jgi:hypothetical protein